jgi:hypothetical protein
MTGFLIWLGIVLLPMIVWALFRKGGYKRRPLDAPPGPGWVRTEERFADPTSGETLEVWFDPQSGKRAYVRARGDASRHL